MGIAAFMLLKLSGNQSPSEEDIKNLFSGLEGKNVNDLIEQGRKKLVFNGNLDNSVLQKKKNSSVTQVDVKKEKEEKEEKEDSSAAVGTLFGESSSINSDENSDSS